ncbi:palmitoyltransferase ZDHHC23-B-like isoform X2 [Daktulosphaira vitifoliae]|uniref:palmitoyltransferase ZDHHC23-B-like isoform X2 n=1 Tax=Daktulosphaira vitifoliae TaxID=58002 RepID=UPI0021AACCFF|nr:palmitoyltransferase ZDHHC23-B-like isoform X2 [Daktulosphaira vitifoliae]
MWKLLVTLLSCPPSRSIDINTMIANIQDHLRVPWRGGARRISLDAAIPLIFFPLTLYIAALGFWQTVILFPLVTLILYFVHISIKKYKCPTKFFYVWTLVSAFLVFIIFQLLVVPMLDINTNENIIILVIMAATAWCFYTSKKYAINSHIKQDFEMTTSHDTSENAILLNETNDTSCEICRQIVPSRTYHCFICKTCIRYQHVHSYWIDCCIGKYNRKPYIAGLILGTIMLAFLSNLILTTLCHPFNVFATIMLPDDCSDVYFDIMYGICFVTGLYCSAVAGILFCMIIYEIFIISMGITNYEYQACIKRTNNQFFWSRHILSNLLSNWKDFFSNF